MWQVCSPFYSQGSGASCLQCLDSVSPNYHCLAIHTGSKGILLSPSQHWVKGLGNSIQRRNKVKQIDMNVSIYSGSFGYTGKEHDCQCIQDQIDNTISLGGVLSKGVNFPFCKNCATTHLLAYHSCEGSCQEEMELGNVPPSSI